MLISSRTVPFVFWKTRASPARMSRIPPRFIGSRMRTSSRTSCISVMPCSFFPGFFPRDRTKTLVPGGIPGMPVTVLPGWMTARKSLALTMRRIVRRPYALFGETTAVMYRLATESAMPSRNGVSMIRRIETPHARIALISLSDDSRPNTSRVETSAAMGIDMESVPGKPSQRKRATIENDAPLAM